MNTSIDRKQYLMCASAGYTCLAFSLLVFLVEGTLVKVGWLSERTPNTLAAIYMAILFLFPASLAYARLLSGKTNTDPDKPSEPDDSHRIVRKSVLVTLAFALTIETFAVGMEANWKVGAAAAKGRQHAVDRLSMRRGVDLNEAGRFEGPLNKQPELASLLTFAQGSSQTTETDFRSFARGMSGGELTPEQLDGFERSMKAAFKAASTETVIDAQWVVDEARRTIKALRESESFDKELSQRVDRLDEIRHFYQRLIDADRTTLAELHARLREAPDRAESMLLYEVAIQVKIPRMIETDPRSAEQIITEEREFLEEFAALTVDVQILDIINGVKQKTLPHYEEKLQEAKELNALLGQPAPPLNNVSTWVNLPPGANPPDPTNKVVLLDFWSVGCGPCVAAFPKLNDWRQRYSEQDLVMLGVTRFYNYEWNPDTAAPVKNDGSVSPAKELAMLQRFLEKHRADFPVAIEQADELSGAFRVRALPQVVLLDRNGVIRLIRNGNSTDDAKVVQERIEQLILEEPRKVQPQLLR